jgi:hypothetical protein
MTNLLRDELALLLLNDDRTAGGWPPVISFDNIENSHGYHRNADAALAFIDQHYIPRASLVSDEMVERAVTAALVSLAESNVPTDIQELLLHGNPSRGIAPKSLRRAVLAAIGEKP